MTCPICQLHASTIGALCNGCAEDLNAPPSVSPEQLVSTGADPTNAALIDAWGRTHRLDPVTTVGRTRQAIRILEPSVSRLHADLARTGGAWFLRDLGSFNGTFVDGRRVGAGRAGARGAHLTSRCMVRFGSVAVYFVADASELATRRPRRAISETRAPSEPGASEMTLEIPSERLPALTIELHEATGGGGVIAVEGKPVQLTIAQLELLRLLVDRMLAETGTDDEIRGFVSSGELVKLSLDAPDPSFDNVRQLVRRVRRLLVKAGIGDLIESRHGLGYRLRVMPRVPTWWPSR